MIIFKFTFPETLIDVFWAEQSIGITVNPIKLLFSVLIQQSYIKTGINNCV
jgi:hypothetical protein